jgi:hypothetical protein
MSGVVGKEILFLLYLRTAIVKAVPLHPELFESFSFALVTWAIE